MSPTLGIIEEISGDGSRDSARTQCKGTVRTVGIAWLVVESTGLLDSEDRDAIPQSLEYL